MQNLQSRSRLWHLLLAGLAVYLFSFLFHAGRADAFFTETSFEGHNLPGKTWTAGPHPVLQESLRESYAWGNTSSNICAGPVIYSGGSYVEPYGWGCKDKHAYEGELWNFASEHGIVNATTAVYNPNSGTIGEYKGGGIAYGESESPPPPPPNPPAATTTAPSEVNLTSAKLNGQVDPDGTDTHYYFEYGTSPSYGSDVPASPGMDLGSGSESIHTWNTISGLASGTLYHYRVVAKSSAGTTFGSDQIFTTGKPEFLPSTRWTEWSPSYTMSLADVNGDGKADLVGYNASTHDVEVGLSTGGSFAESTKWTEWSPAYSVAFADVNGDGKADLIGYNASTGDIQVALSTGSGFLSSTKWGGPWSSAYKISLADVNGDGKADLIGYNASTGDIQVSLSTGSAFPSSTKWGGPWSSAYAMSFADANGDGKADLIGYNASTGDIQVSPSTGAAFPSSTKWGGPWSSAYPFIPADVNGDGMADLVGRNTSTGAVVVGLSTGSAFPTSAVWGYWSTTYSIALADVNGDGKADLVGRNAAGDVEVSLSGA
jgi:hypothetical protein